MWGMRKEGIYAQEKTLAPSEQKKIQTQTTYLRLIKKVVGLPPEWRKYKNAFAKWVL